jgi:hypothetical protein
LIHSRIARLFSLQNTETGCGAYIASYLVVTGGFFLEVKEAKV